MIFENFDLWPLWPYSLQPCGLCNLAEILHAFQVVLKTSEYKISLHLVQKWLSYNTFYISAMAFYLVTLQGQSRKCRAKRSDMFHILAKTIQLCAPQSPMDPYGDRNQLCHIYLIEKQYVASNKGRFQAIVNIKVKKFLLVLSFVL